MTTAKIYILFVIIFYSSILLHWKVLEEEIQHASDLLCVVVVVVVVVVLFVLLALLLITISMIN